MSIKIDQAFTSAILTGGLALDVVHEGGIYSVWGGSSYTTSTGTYTPNAQRAYLEIKTFPAGKEPLSLKHTDEAVGLYQCIVRYPIDTGSIDAKTKAESVIALFKVGSILTYDGQDIHIESNSRDGGIVEEGFYKIVVRANYRAFLQR